MLEEGRAWLSVDDAIVPDPRGEAKANPCTTLSRAATSNTRKIRVMTSTSSSSGIPTDPKPIANRLTLSVARQLWEKALALAPDDPAMQQLAADVFSHGVPSWHFAIVRDERRNAAYDAGCVVP